jgi:hypothetical protein
MTDKTSVEGIAIWLKQVFGSNSWMAGRVAQELNDDILEVIQTQYPTYHANIRIGLLFALLCLRKGQHQYLRDNINKVSSLFISVWLADFRLKGMGGIRHGESQKERPICIALSEKPL